ncbi:MAG: thiamine-phosphate kinase [Armatimonadota bacterium]|nr:thiamine-phosphate kinase [Armatimonadota bacterium]MCX7776819.1 thiamine-phosphate kinase [Armatimonadota bacterium]MDW8024614.1 thiamine-phosphate kinase [Armatimonadota bacterium]
MSAKKKKMLKDVGEWGLLKWLYSEIGRHLCGRMDVAVGIGDDSAVVNVNGPIRIAITTDALIEGIHFERTYSTPYDLGWKALAVNLSDLAATFAEPIAAFVTVALPSDTTIAWVRQFYRGMIDLAERFDVAILGGDTSSSEDGIFISVSAIGRCGDKLPARSNAKPGSSVIVTGTLGESAIGLLALQRLGRETVMRSRTLKRLAERHLRPVPRLKEGLVALSTGLCECAIDVSDGLVSDLSRVAEMSGVRIRLWFENLPISPQAIEASKQLACSPLEMALYGGEDYELLMTIPTEYAHQVCNTIESSCKVKCSIIGVVEAGKPYVYGIDERGKHLRLAGGYEHFRA